MSIKEAALAEADVKDSGQSLYAVLEQGPDRSWASRGNCHYSRRTPGMEEAWTQTRGQPGYNREKEQLALASCHICPVQWQCCTYAIDTQGYTTKDAMWTFIYAVRPTERKLISRQAEWRDMLEEARAQAMPVAMVVKRLQSAAPDLTQEEQWSQSAV